MLSADDLGAGVLSDQIVRLTGHGAPRQLLRVVEVRDASKPDQTVRLLTSLTDAQVPAHVIGNVYRKRWQVELFFRPSTALRAVSLSNGWLKVWCNFDHLLSTDRRGITTQFYVIVIATLLMHIHLGQRVSKYTLIALHLIASGRATPEQMQPFLARRTRERELEQLRRGRAKQKQA